MSDCLPDPRSVYSVSALRRPAGSVTDISQKNLVNPGAKQSDHVSQRMDNPGDLCTHTGLRVKLPLPHKTLSSLFSLFLVLTGLQRCQYKGRDGGSPVMWASNCVFFFIDKESLQGFPWSSSDKSDKHTCCIPILLRSLKSAI